MQLGHTGRLAEQADVTGASDSRETEVGAQPDGHSVHDVCAVFVNDKGGHTVQLTVPLTLDQRPGPHRLKQVELVRTVSGGP